MPYAFNPKNCVFVESARAHPIAHCKKVEPGITVGGVFSALGAIGTISIAFLYCNFALA
jgi:hypothetical protein